MSRIFLQNIIAVVWDFDKTLIPGYMQAPLFEQYAVDEKQFWQEVNALPAMYQQQGVEQVSTEALYLNHILAHVEDGRFAGLTNAKLRELGGKLSFYPGLPDFFQQLQARVLEVEKFAAQGVTIEHYIVSTGLRQMIMGSQIAPFVDGVWGCELLDNEAEPEKGVNRLAYLLDNTTKTRALFEINKGTNKHAEIDVNAVIQDEDRRIPFQNMIYIADGPSDVPVFSVLKRFGGRTFAVYRSGSTKEFQQANALQNQGRVQSFGEAIYQKDSQTGMWLWNAIQEIATRITRDRERALGDRVSRPPQHIND